MHRAGRGLALSLSILLMSLAGGCGGDDGASDAEVQRQRDDAAQQARQEERIKQLEREQRNLKKEKGKSGGSGGGSGGSSGGGSGGSATAGAGRTQCGGGLSVGANTTCPFAQVVRDAYNASGGASTFTAYSPVTGKDYSMSCTSGSPHVCTGGNNASVYFP